MKKTAILFSALIMFTVFVKADQTEDYGNAMRMASAVERIKALENYLVKYQTSEYHKYVYAQLAADYVGQANYQKAFEFAKKAEGFLAELKLDDKPMAELYLVLGAYYLDQKNQDKALSYAEKILSLGAGKQGGGWDVLLDSAKKIKRATGSSSSPLNKAITLYNKQDYLGAEKEFAELYKSDKTFETVSWYAKSLEKNRKTDLALEKFKEAHKLKPDGLTAYNIGVILARKAKIDNKFINEAVSYFLQASFLCPEKSKAAMELAQGLFFSNYKDAETGFSYNELIQKSQEMTNKLNGLTTEFNKKYGNKDEEEVDKKQMDADSKTIENLKKDSDKFSAKIQKAIDEFNKLVNQYK